MFLIKAGLDPAAYVATGVMIAVIVDLSRLPVYFTRFSGLASGFDSREAALIATATASAFAGAFLVVRFLDKTTIGAVRAIVSALLFLIGAALIAGLVGA